MQSGEMILLVDDDVMHLAPLREELELGGYEVVTATTVEQAQHIVRTCRRLDAAILDMMILPSDQQTTEEVLSSHGGRFGGLEVARYIQRHRSELPFIGISAFNNAFLERWFGAVKAPFLLKSTMSANLLEVVSMSKRPSILGIESSTDREIVPVHAPTRSERASELQLRLKQLEYEYELSRQGMAKGQLATILAITGAGLTVTLAFLSSMFGKREFLSGSNIVVIIVAMVLALLGFASLVFGRAARLRGLVSKTKKELEITLGERVR
jgi:CheY-like chemotaxis protein